jgi:hypothetical protein
VLRIKKAKSDMKNKPKDSASAGETRRCFSTPLLRGGFEAIFRTKPDRAMGEVGLGATKALFSAGGSCR